MAPSQSELAQGLPSCLFWRSILLPPKVSPSQEERADYVRGPAAQRHAALCPMHANVPSGQSALKRHQELPRSILLPATMSVHLLKRRQG